MDAKSVVLKKFCSCGNHEVIDDGKGVLKPIGKNGSKRWQCSACVSHQKKGTFSFNVSGKGKAGRKPKPNEDYDISDQIEERNFIRQILGI